MVATTIDPVRVPVLNLTNDEIAEAEELIAAGKLPSDWFAQCAAAREKNVFGADHKKDRDGRPIEQGIGSPGNMTRNAVEAYRRWNKDEPDFERNLARMEKDLIASDARRAAERAAAPKGRRFL